MTDLTDRLYERLLVLRCQTGDATAFAELVERYQPRLHYFLRKLLGETHRAEDVLQDVWLDVFRSLARLKDAGAFPAWLYRIARDRAFREFRRPTPAYQPLDAVDVADDSGDEDFSAEDAAAVHTALDRLPPEQREALLLRFLEGMRYEEIARVTGSPVGTVRSRLYYGKQALRRILERTGEHDGERPRQGPPAAGFDGAGRSSGRAAADVEDHRA